MTYEIPAPGVYLDKPFEWYEAIPAVNRRKLTLLALSPAHVKWAEANPEKKQSKALKVGIATHSRVLERKKEDVTLTALEEELVTRVQQSVLAHKKATAALSGAACEVTLVWQDPETHLLCKARPDAMRSDLKTIYDLKTCNAIPDFALDIFKKGYHQQAAWYLQGAQTLGLDIRHFKFIAVEKKPIYGCRIYDLSPAGIDLGTFANHDLLRRYKSCVLTGKWPGYPEEEELVQVPSFKMTELAIQQEEII